MTYWAPGDESVSRLRQTLTLVLLLALHATTWSFQAEVVGVTDGDTLTVLSNDRTQIRCRLAGIDAPEKGQAFGSASKQSLSDLSFRKIVEVTVIDRDRYGRSVCMLQSEGLDLNLEQVRRGMAWVYRRYNHDTSYLQAEENAKRARRGLWADPAQVPPWDFRQELRKTRNGAPVE